MAPGLRGWPAAPRALGALGRGGSGPRDSSARWRLVLAGAVSLGAWILLQWVAPPVTIHWSFEMIEASREMAEELESASRHCLEVGILVDASVDPNGTCLIGPQLSPLFTTLGQLGAKRTTMNPDLAGLLVHLLQRAGVSAGDTVAVGASGSFPGLMLATLSATRALGAHPLGILSLGASSYGASRPEFHLLDLHELLRREGFLSGPPAAVSLGGGGDVGLELDRELTEELRLEVEEAGVPFLDEPHLRANVARRMAIYGRPAVFVNIGGGHANLGTSALVLEVPPGLSTSLELPLPEERGVLFEMAARDVPVIHLLHLRGLALRFGLPWDPIPLPEPASTPLRDGEPTRGWGFWVLTVAFFGALSFIGFFGLRARSRSDGDSLLNGPYTFRR